MKTLLVAVVVGALFAFLNAAPLTVNEQLEVLQHELDCIEEDYNLVNSSSNPNASLKSVQISIAGLEKQLDELQTNNILSPNEKAQHDKIAAQLNQLAAKAGVPAPWQQLDKLQVTFGQLVSEFYSAKSANDVAKVREVQNKVAQLKTQLDAFGTSSSNSLEGWDKQYYDGLQSQISQLQSDAANFVNSH